MLDSNRQVFWLLAVPSLVLLFLPSAAQAASADERFLEGLRARRLFGLAESFCRERLADEELHAAAYRTLQAAHEKLLNLFDVSESRGATSESFWANTIAFERDECMLELTE